MVRSIRPNAPDLPSVVKIDLYQRIQQEWDAYKSCIQYRLPNVAEIRGEPVNPMGSIYSGLWYPLAGAGVDGIDSLQNFLLNTPAENIGPFLERRLFRRFAALWQQASIGAEYNFRTTYDEFLPLNLVIDCTTPVGQPGWLSPETYNGNWPVGDYVNISGFKVVKLLRKKQGLSLDIPDSHKAFRIHVYGVENAGEYEIGQIIQRPFSGLIKETRQRALKNLAQNVLGVEVNLEESVLTSPDGRSLPNPLTNYSQILSRSQDVKLACIHGDLNMENVLVQEETEDVHLIDFAKSRQDHVLRDLLHLEMAVVNKILSRTMAEEDTAAGIIHDLYQRLHCAVVRGQEIAPPAGQERVFTILRTIRQVAQPLLFSPDKWEEYYNGLFIYLLGSLRFGDLDKPPIAPRPKALAFWGAAAVLDLMENEPNCSQFKETASASKPKAKGVDPVSVTEQRVDSSWNIDQIVGDWQIDPLSQRLILFNILKTKFSLEELKELAHSLGIDLDDLPPGGRGLKAQELLGYFERRGQIRNLLVVVSRSREKSIPWQ
jgi:hypothetical protein